MSRPTAPPRCACPAGVDLSGVEVDARRVRHRILRLSRREVLVREPRPTAGRDRGRLGVPLSRTAARRPARSASSSASPARPPTPSPPCATCARRAAASSRSSTSRPRPSPARATSPCRSWPAPRSASPRPRPSPASSPFSPPSRIAAGPPARHARRGRGGAPRRRARRRPRARRPGARRRAARSPRSPATSPAPATCSFSAAAPSIPLALEGALKLKEISYIHAEGYAAGELKHGPIALIDEEVPVVVLAPSDALFDKTVSNMQEVMARDGRVLLISDAAGVADAGGGTWRSARHARRRSLRRADPLRRPGRSSSPTTPPCSRAPTSTSRATSRSP